MGVSRDEGSLAESGLLVAPLLLKTYVKGTPDSFRSFEWNIFDSDIARKRTQFQDLAGSLHFSPQIS